MKYGYFDDINHEYVITNPKTPSPWANYLGDPNYGAIISNNAGGYSFVKSGANGRILRYYFNSFDEPGRYIYIQDNKTKDFFSTSWGPVHKDLKKYKTECRHGLAYTSFNSSYKSIYTKTTYYVPLNSEYEIWYLEVTNKSKETKKLNITGYAEFTNNSNYEHDMVNLQYSLFISKTQYKDNMIIQTTDGNLEKLRPNDVSHRFFGLINSKVNSYTGDKEKFLGPYRNYSNPIGIEKGKLDNELNYCMNSCGALNTIITLKPKQTKKLAFVLGMKKASEAKKIMASYKDIEVVNKELKDLKSYWLAKLENFKVKTPSKEFNSMINTWHSYNCFITFIWSRAASLIYCGLRNGYGYRDTVQDIQGVIHLDPKAAKERISFMLSAQVNNGAGLPLVKYTHNPGHEDKPGDESYNKETGHPEYRADDAMWLFPTVYKYIGETGDIKYLDEIILYSNEGKDSVYNHLKKAIEFTENNIGKHNLPVGLHADWNDCLRLGKLGESTFLAFQYYYALNIMEEFAKEKNDEAYLKHIKKVKEKLDEELNKCFKDNRFIRGYKEDGTIIGDPKDKEANIWLNPQSFAVISGFADHKRSTKALNLVHSRLNTKYGAKLMDPPYFAHAFPGALQTTYNQGIKENGSIFNQAQGWLILAESLLGRGNRAFEYYKESSPAYQNENGQIRVMEPYCYGQFTESEKSLHFGRSHVHWLTGTASTIMVGVVEGILGMRPDIYGLRIAPSIPSSWKKLEIDKVFRNKKLHIRIINSNNKESGYKEVYLNKVKLQDNYINEKDLKENNEILYVM